MQLAEDGTLTDSVDLAIQTFGTESKDASLEVCFQCHAAKGLLQPGYQPGDDLSGLSHSPHFTSRTDSNLTSAIWWKPSLHDRVIWEAYPSGGRQR